MNERPRNHSKSSCGSAPSMIAPSSASEVTLTCAASSSARRCAALGAAATNRSRRARTTFGMRSGAKGADPPVLTTSATSTRASGWPWVNARTAACWASGTRRSASSERLSSGRRFCSGSAGRSVPMPGSDVQSGVGGWRPAMTTTARAGSCGKKRLSKPRIERREQLYRVQHQHEAIVADVDRRAGSPPARLQRVAKREKKSARRRIDDAAVDRHGGDPLGRRQPRAGAKECGLPHPSQTVDVKHRTRRSSAGRAARNRRKLLLPTPEPAAPAAARWSPRRGKPVAVRSRHVVLT